MTKRDTLILFYKTEGWTVSEIASVIDPTPSRQEVSRVCGKYGFGRTEQWRARMRRRKA